MTRTKRLGLVSVAVALCLCIIPIFAGCDLVSLNRAKYLSEVVASFDNGRITVTKEELINGYYSFGNSRYDSGGEVTKEGVQSTLDLLMDRAVLLDYLTKVNEDTNKAIINLTTAQYNEIWRNVYESLNSQIKAIEDDLRRADDAALPNGEDEEEEETNVYTPYEKTYTLEGGVLKKIQKEKVVENKSVAPYDTSNQNLTDKEKAAQAYANFRKTYWNYTDSILVGGADTIQDATKTSYSDKAFSKFIQQLKKNEEGKNLSVDNEGLFFREVERLYKLYYENAVLSAYQESYSENNLVTGAMAVTKYNEIYNGQVEKYTSNPSAYTAAMKSDGGTVYYHPSGVSDWFKVGHVLLGFSDEQTAKLTQLKTDFEQQVIPSKAEYDALVAAEKAKTKAYNRETKEYEDINTVYANLQAELNASRTFQEKTAIFAQYMYKYTTDDSTLTTNMCYFIPSDPENDQMVKPFADSARQLREGIAGDISGFVESEYGYHVIMYLGELDNVVSSSNNEALLYKLDSTVVNPMYNKTLLDTVIEKVTVDYYASHESALLKQIKGTTKIVYYPNAYKDLY